MSVFRNSEIIHLSSILTDIFAFYWQERNDCSTWHESVEVFDVIEEDGKKRNDMYCLKSLLRSFHLCEDVTIFVEGQGAKFFPMFQHLWPLSIWRRRFTAWYSRTLVFVVSSRVLFCLFASYDKHGNPRHNLTQIPMGQREMIREEYNY
jgi:hypothetical protein